MKTRVLVSFHCTVELYSVPCARTRSVSWSCMYVYVVKKTGCLVPYSAKCNELLAL